MTSHQPEYPPGPPEHEIICYFNRTPKYVFCEYFKRLNICSWPTHVIFLHRKPCSRYFHIGVIIWRYWNLIDTKFVPEIYPPWDTTYIRSLNSSITYGLPPWYFKALVKEVLTIFPGVWQLETTDEYWNHFGIPPMPFKNYHAANKTFKNITAPLKGSSPYDTVKELMNILPRKLPSIPLYILKSSSTTCFTVGVLNLNTIFLNPYVLLMRKDRSWKKWLNLYQQG